MGRSYDDLFTFVMEADDDIQTFDMSMDDMGDEAPAETPPDTTTDTANDGSDNLPPEQNEDADNTFNFNMDDGGDNNDTTDEAGGDEEAADDGDTEGEDIGTKTNDILNERLYRRLTDRNAEIENIVEQIQKVLVALPYETVKEIDRPLNQLKTALAKGQNYAIDKFIYTEYGENLLFFEKLNSCYILIEDTIDGILKKASKNDTTRNK